jgi:hypothetical protein
MKVDSNFVYLFFDILPNVLKAILNAKMFPNMHKDKMITSRKLFSKVNN